MSHSSLGGFQLHAAGRHIHSPKVKQKHQKKERCYLKIIAMRTDCLPLACANGPVLENVLSPRKRNLSSVPSSVWKDVSARLISQELAKLLGTLAKNFGQMKYLGEQELEVRPLFLSRKCFDHYYAFFLSGPVCGGIIATEGILSCLSIPTGLPHRPDMQM